MLGMERNGSIPVDHQFVFDFAILVQAPNRFLNNLFFEKGIDFTTQADVTIAGVEFDVIDTRDIWVSSDRFVNLKVQLFQVVQY